MKNRIKELEKQLTEMVENFSNYDYRKNALRELEEVEQLGKKNYPNMAFIIQQYPNFNSICFKISQPNHFVVSISINVDDLKGNPKAIHNAAKMISHWYKNGGKKEN